MRAGRRPLLIPLVRHRHVRRQRGVLMRHGRSHVGGDPLALREDLDRRGRHPDVHLRADQPEGHTVVVAVDRDVIVDVDGRLPPLRLFIGYGWQGLGGRPVPRLKELPPGALELAQGPGIQPLQEFTDRGDQLSQGREEAMAQGGGDPALHNQDPAFHLRLVARPPGPGGHHGAAVMFGERLVGRIQVGLVATGLEHAASQIIRDHEVGHDPEIGGGPGMGANPGGQILRRADLDIGVVGGAPDGHEERGGRPRVGLGIDQREAIGEVDEELLPVAVDLAQTDIALAPPPVIVGDKLRVLVPVGVLGLVLSLELVQRQIDAPRVPELLLDGRVVRQGPRVALQLGRRAMEQAGF